MTPQQQPTVLERLREAWRRFPKPLRSKDTGRTDTDRCVGGIVCLVADDPEYHPKFPCSQSIAMALMKLNPCLDAERSAVAGESIQELNDAGDFDSARRIAEKAVMWKPATTEPQQQS